VIMPFPVCIQLVWVYSWVIASVYAKAQSASCVTVAACQDHITGSGLKD
jgi:hypothetical protein